MLQWNDISNWQKGWRVSGPIVAKAGEGLAFTDGLFADFCAQAAAIGAPCYAYYALHAGSPEAQARRAAGIIGSRPAMFDVEDWPQESGSPAGIASLAELLSAVDHYRGLGGVMNVCYLPRSQWMNMGHPDLTPLAGRGVRIINADYRFGDAISSPAWEPYGGVTPWALQYAAENNTFPGTAEEWRAVWEGKPATPAPTPAAAGNALDRLPVLRQGATGPYVSILEGLLIGHAYPTSASNPAAVDGQFGGTVDGSVRRFQTARRITVDGVVGGQTWAALLTA